MTLESHHCATVTSIYFQNIFITPDKMVLFSQKLPILPHPQPHVLVTSNLLSASMNLLALDIPSSSVHGIIQGRILEWVAISSSRGSSQSKDQTQVSCIAGEFFTIWTTREALHISGIIQYLAFYNWLTSLGMEFSSSIHVVACIKTSFLFYPSSIPFVERPHFVYSFIVSNFWLLWLRLLWHECTDTL